MSRRQGWPPAAKQSTNNPAGRAIPALETTPRYVARRRGHRTMRRSARRRPPRPRKACQLHCRSGLGERTVHPRLRFSAAPAHCRMAVHLDHVDVGFRRAVVDLLVPVLVARGSPPRSAACTFQSTPRARGGHAPRAGPTSPAKLRPEFDGVRSCRAIRSVLPCSFESEDGAFSQVPCTLACLRTFMVAWRVYLTLA